MGRRGILILKNMKKEIKIIIIILAILLIFITLYSILKSKEILLSPDSSKYYLLSNPSYPAYSSALIYPPSSSIGNIYNKAEEICDLNNNITGLWKLENDNWVSHPCGGPNNFDLEKGKGYLISTSSAGEIDFEGYQEENVDIEFYRLSNFDYISYGEVMLPSSWNNKYAESLCNYINGLEGIWQMNEVTQEFDGHPCGGPNNFLIDTNKIVLLSTNKEIIWNPSVWEDKSIINFNVDGKDYDVSIAFIQGSETKFLVNNEFTTMMNAQSSPYSLQYGAGGLYIIPKEISTYDYVGAPPNYVIAYLVKEVNITEGGDNDLVNLNVDGNDYNVSINFVTSSSVRLQVNGQLTNTLSKQNSPYQLYPYYQSTKIENLDIMVDDFFVYDYAGGEKTVALILAYEVNLIKEEIINCAQQGEWYEFTDPSVPDECCENLDDVHSTDSISVADECYWTGTATGYPGGVCSDCGNGICN